MSTFELIELIIIALVILFLTVYYLIKAIKNKWLQNISIEIEKAIKEAEDLAKKGEIEKVFKKQFVLDKIEKKCEELEIPYHFIKQLISKLIDRIVKDHNVFVKKIK